MNATIEALVLKAIETIANLDKAEADRVEAFRVNRNATYVNKSGPNGKYYRNRCYVYAWNQNWAHVQFEVDGPIRRMSRNHVVID